MQELTFCKNMYLNDDQSWPEFYMLYSVPQMLHKAPQEEKFRQIHNLKLQNVSRQIKTNNI